MTKLRFYTNIIVVLLITVAAIIFTGNSLALYADFPSLILGVILPYIIISFIYTPTEQIRFNKEIFKQADIADKKELEKSLGYFKSFKKLLIVSAVTWTIVGFIGMMANLKDKTAIGPNFGVLVIVPLYMAVFIMIILEPLRASAEKNLKD